MTAGVIVCALLACLAVPLVWDSETLGFRMQAMAKKFKTRLYDGIW